MLRRLVGITPLRAIRGVISRRYCAVAGRNITAISRRSEQTGRYHRDITETNRRMRSGA